MNSEQFVNTQVNTQKVNSDKNQHRNQFFSCYWTVHTRNIDANGDDGVEPQNVLESGYEEEHVIQCKRHEGDEYSHGKTEPNPIEPAWRKKA